MHLTVVIFTVFAAWRWADWRRWPKYHPTMLFVAVGNLFYNFIYHDHLLWELKPDILLSHKVGEIFYTFAVFPLTAFLLLSHFPRERARQVYRVTLFVVIYIVVELVFHTFGRIVYAYGWSIWWSLAWDVMMFPVWILHHRRSLTAYGVTALITAAIILRFPVEWV